MVKLVGFEAQDEELLTGMMRRFRRDEFLLHGLSAIERTSCHRYNGRVHPRLEGGRLEMTMQLSTTNPFTVAHELAHVSDITVRRDEAVANMAGDQPGSWHLAHRMSAEYYANRIACAYSDEKLIFGAFMNDMTGLTKAAARQEWGEVMINYALMLGIFHGMDRLDHDPRGALPANLELPEAVHAGMDGFMTGAKEFFEGYGELRMAA